MRTFEYLAVVALIVGLTAWGASAISSTIAGSLNQSGQMIAIAAQ